MPERPQARATVLADGDAHRITRFDFAPGAETGWHRHEFDYVITTLSECRMTLEQKDGGTDTVTLPAGRSYHRPAGVSHNVINGSATPMAFVEVEFRQGLDLDRLDQG